MLWGAFKGTRMELGMMGLECWEGSGKGLEIGLRGKDLGLLGDRTVDGGD